jgi:hypothetical protein
MWATSSGGKFFRLTKRSDFKYGMFTLNWYIRKLATMIGHKSHRFLYADSYPPDALSEVIPDCPVVVGSNFQIVGKMKYEEGR